MNYRLLILLVVIFSLFVTSCKDNSTNIIQNQIDTVKICNQVWMKKNLDVDHYRNGDPIPQVTDPVQWSKLTTGAWCYYNNDPELGKIYGKLYNWYAINDPRRLAPEGWHVASSLEWNSLISCLGSDTLAGGKIKETGFDHWNSPNTGATNETGFTLLPGGGRDGDGTFPAMIGQNAWLWTSTYNQGAKCILVLSFDGGILQNSYSGNLGMSVRCIKD